MVSDDDEDDDMDLVVVVAVACVQVLLSEGEFGSDKDSSSSYDDDEVVDELRVSQAPAHKTAVPSTATTSAALQTNRQEQTQKLHDQQQPRARQKAQTQQVAEKIRRLQRERQLQTETIRLATRKRALRLEQKRLELSEMKHDMQEALHAAKKPTEQVSEYLAVVNNMHASKCSRGNAQVEGEREHAEIQTLLEKAVSLKIMIANGKTAQECKDFWLRADQQ